MLDNTDPAAIAEIKSADRFQADLVPGGERAYTSTETLSFYRYFHARMVEQGIDPAGTSFVAITEFGEHPWWPRDAAPVLSAHFRESPGYRPLSSAISYFGLLPMALIGMDMRDTVNQALQMRQSTAQPFPQTPIPASALEPASALTHGAAGIRSCLVLSPHRWARVRIKGRTTDCRKHGEREGTGLILFRRGKELGNPNAYREDPACSFF